MIFLKSIQSDRASYVENGPSHTCRETERTRTVITVLPGRGSPDTALVGVGAAATREGATGIGVYQAVTPAPADNGPAVTQGAGALGSASAVVVPGASVAVASGDTEVLNTASGAY
jgi:hypothetical protein